jgi:hypothetical protein
MMKWKNKTWCNETLTSFFSGVGVETGGVADAAALEMSNIFRVRAANCVCSAGNWRRAEGTAATIVSNRTRAWLRPDTMNLSSTIASGSVQNVN